MPSTFRRIACRLITAGVYLALPAAAREAPDTDSFSESVVPLPQGIDGGCYSYWGNEGRDWATLIIGKTVFDRLAAVPVMQPLARRLLANVDPKPDAWGCKHIRDTRGGPLAMIFYLLESGQAAVIDDAANGPAKQILVRVHEDRSRKTTYHLRADSLAFLVQDPIRIEGDESAERERNRPRRPWEIETMAVTEQNQQRVDFARRFMASCTSEDPAKRAFFRAHIHDPLTVRFSVVDENGAHGNAKTVDTRHARDSSKPLGLPLCVGDGGLDDVTLGEYGARMTLELSFGSGPAEVLHFSSIGGEWQLTFAEWVDH